MHHNYVYYKRERLRRPYLIYFLVGQKRSFWENIYNVKRERFRRPYLIYFWSDKNVHYSKMYKVHINSLNSATWHIRSTYLLFNTYDHIFVELGTLWERNEIHIKSKKNSFNTATWHIRSTYYYLFCTTIFFLSFWAHCECVFTWNWYILEVHLFFIIIYCKRPYFLSCWAHCECIFKYIIGTM